MPAAEDTHPQEASASTPKGVAIEVSAPASGPIVRERGYLTVLGNIKAGCDRGKVFQFRAQDLTAIIGPWASQGGSLAHVKDGKGAVLRACNPRTGKESGVLLWGCNDIDGSGAADAHGCWNPVEFCTTDDWQTGDTVELLDFCEEDVLVGVPLPVVKHECLTGTGWNLDGEHIQWGRCGIVGDWWKALEVQFDFDREYRVTGVRTDSVDLPFSVSYLAKTGKWVQATSGLTGFATVIPFVASSCRLSWADTNMHQLRGLSTYRSGGGVHAAFVGCDHLRSDVGGLNSNSSCVDSHLNVESSNIADIAGQVDGSSEGVLALGADILASRGSLHPTTLGGAKLTRIADRATLDALQGCLETKPEWLGVGRDVEHTSSTYSGLRLCAAWGIHHKIDKARYELAKQELQEHLATSPSGFPPVEVKSFAWGEALGVPLDASISEVLLVHGAKAASLAAVLNTGLNERFSSGLFGSGTYLADDAGKADQYCTIDSVKQRTKLHEALYPGDTEHPGNIYYLLLCRAVLGHAAVTLDGTSKADGRGALWASGDRRELGNIPGVDPPVAHHSLIAETGKAIMRYREVVVFHSERVISDYLIAYRRTLATK
eukprot:TRINITY_DN48712_c0_g1_i1.p1 TRINITY_DN48712_c0_g1~~TRINITY_DN48712_c0_g1_i1.p1  ORF type:complete len:654 (+),score=73.63 TRINITY_DN48712_c0_g1_i1:158-1963(+)